jgi:hypothetical protein
MRWWTPPSTFSFDRRRIVNRRQKLIIVEAAAAFGLIMLYIWRLRFTAPRAWVFILGFFVLSHILRGERAASLGFRRANFRECLRTLAPALVLLTLSLMAAGVLLETIRPVSPEYGFMCLLAYCPWGIFQQYLLNGYIANRLLAVSPARHVPLLAAALFAGAHLPNWFLMPVTFVTGYYSTKIFMRYRNLYFLGMAHALIGTALFIVIPDSISHHLKVGPGFFGGAPARTLGYRDAAPETTGRQAMLKSTLVSDRYIAESRVAAPDEVRIGYFVRLSSTRTPPEPSASTISGRPALEDWPCRFRHQDIVRIGTRANGKGRCIFQASFS